MFFFEPIQLQHMPRHRHYHPYQQELNPLEALFSDLLMAGEEESEPDHYRGKDGFHAKISLDGYKPEDIFVQLEGDDQLVVTGMHKEENGDQDSMEKTFKRCIPLDKSLDIQNIVCELDGDQLEVFIPRIEVEKKPIHIEIKKPKVPEEEAPGGESKETSKEDEHGERDSEKSEEIEEVK